LRFNIVSIFPEFFDSPLSCGLMRKGAEAGIVDFAFVNPRDFTTDAHRSVDDRPYGGGPGMVMLPGPLSQALESIDSPGRMLLLSPRGRPMDQRMAEELALEPELTLICGRYEGVDERITEIFPVEEVSAGDFVLNGGEAAALCLIESVSRLLSGFMGHEHSAEEESFARGLLEYPQYTRPEKFRGLGVPEILLSGDHARIADWRRRMRLIETWNRRPELLESAKLGDRDLKHLRQLSSGSPESLRPRPGRNLHLALLHHPVMNKKGEKGAVSLTNLDIHDIGRVSRTFGLGGFHIVTPLADQRELAARLIGHWTDGPGRRAIPDRAEALAGVEVHAGLEDAVEAVAEQSGGEPLLAATTARGTGTGTLTEIRDALDRGGVLLILGTASGLDREVLERADKVLRPIRFLSGYNHLSVRSAAAIIVDRLLGDAL
jgi:tRNA (guanine37-N1)-methyltransferase